MTGLGDSEQERSGPMARATSARALSSRASAFAAMGLALVMPGAGVAQPDPPAPTDRGPTASYRDLLRNEAEAQRLPVDIADAVMAVESGYDPTVVGGVGEVGLMQVRPETATMLGFHGSPAELAAPAINIHYGVTYLAGAWRQTGGNLCEALMKYRSGYGQTVMTPLSVRYCGRANAHLLTVHSPFALSGPLPVAAAGVTDPGTRTVSVQPEPRVRTARVSAAFWARKMAHVRAVSQRIERRWSKVAAQ